MARIMFVSDNNCLWGGSEELWARVAIHMADRRHSVSVAKPQIRTDQKLLAELSRKADRMCDLEVTRMVLIRIGLRLLRYGLPRRFESGLFLRPTDRLTTEMKRCRPDLIVISQGANWSGHWVMASARRSRIPYITIAQKASDLSWPPDSLLTDIRQGYAQARQCLFVSEHNWRTTEQQLGLEIPHGRVVRNPFLVDYASTLPWPKQQGPLRLACIARLYPSEKGQDMLLRVLSMQRWRDRDVHVSFYGEGVNAEGLQAMANHLKLPHVRFMGQTDDIAAVWADHHALVLPSRTEGLPLVVVEAMLAGRVVIATDVGGTAEVIEDGKTGYVVANPTEAALDAALERAWQERDSWPEMAARAAVEIRKLVPPDPARQLADEIEALLRNAPAPAINTTTGVAA